MHWVNSNFQYAYFLFGSCHTAIEAHKKCMEALEDRWIAVEANDDIDDIDGARKPHTKNRGLKCLEQAKAEIAFLTECKQVLEKHIGFEPTTQDYQDNQRLEWKLEFQHRAENYLMCAGGIPPDQFSSMRSHPDFEEIMQTVESVKTKLMGNEKYVLSKPEWHLSSKLFLDAVKNKPTQDKLIKENT